MDEMQADLVVRWYLELEARLEQTLGTVLYTRETEQLFLPPLANIVLDACSLLDAVLREEYMGPKRREDLTIADYSEHFEGVHNLGSVRTVIYQYPLAYVQPFSDWFADGVYRPLEWWQAYNRLKHDRIQKYRDATLNNAVQALCALHQVVSRRQIFLNALIRQDIVCFGNWGSDYAKEAVYRDDNKVTILIETELFATPLGAAEFPDDIRNISPYWFGSGRKLWRYVGRAY